MQWCKDYVTFTINMLKNVIFSDECRFDLFPKTQTHVRRPKNCRFMRKYTQNTLKYGGASIWFGVLLKATGLEY